MKIIYSRKFVSEYKKLPANLKELAEKKERIFKADPFDPKLKTHKLTGKLKEYWSFSLDHKNRIIVYFESKKESWFISIGSHKIYRK